MTRAGRTRPYTDLGVQRLPCARCRTRPGRFQWRICADGLWRPLCVICDRALNRLMLRWIRDPDAEEKFARYAET